MTVATSEWLKPSRFGDVFVLMGSGQKLHVMALTHAKIEKGMKLAVCGRRGRKISIQAFNSTPENTARRHQVCADCREFCRGVNV